MTLLAQSGLDPVSGALLQYGALGVLALVLLIAVRTLYVRLTGDADAHRQRADRLQEEIREINTTVREPVVRALTEATSVMAETLDVLRRERDGQPPRPPRNRA